LAGNLAGLGRLSEAIPIYVNLVEDFPRDPLPCRLLGIAYGLSGEWDKAVETFRKLAAIAPGPDAYFNLGLAWAQKGDLGEAAAALQKYLDDPRDEPPQKIEQARLELQRIKARTR
jgi:tetratricopeptide (TPR) repeat protein